MHYINGVWVESGSHRFASTNPATNDVLWEGWAAGESEIHSATESARACFESWADAGYEHRYAIINKFKELVEERKEELAVLIAKEMGKALWDARNEAASVCSKLAFATEAYHERTGIKQRPMAGGKAIVTHRPHGVMAVYGPYNFPAHLPNGHIIPALLAGNTVVFKPSEHTPLVAEWTVKRWIEAGLPAGVLNLVQGERDTGIFLSKEKVDGILFTGSSATGKLLHAQLAGRPEVLLALEMGGNNPLIVSSVSDIRAATHEVIMSAYTGTGQRCTCARRLIVIEDQNTEAFVASIVEASANLPIGAYDSTPEPFMGPLVSLREAERILKAQEMLENLGGKVLLRMRQLQQGTPFLSPAIIDMTGVKAIPDEEYFGPLLKLHRVTSLEEAIHLANDTSYGLSAAILTDSHAEYQLVKSKLRAGLLNWNKQTTGASGAGPFGGTGISGNHRPAGYYSADYCSYPVASIECDILAPADKLPPGLK